MRLDGRVAVLSGGSTGIGAATARLFASKGAQVAVIGRHTKLNARVTAADSFSCV